MIFRRFNGFRECCKVDRLWFCGWLLGLVTSCSTAHYRESANREVARIIERKTPAVRNMDSAFSIKQVESTDLSALPRLTKADEFLGAEGRAELGAYIVTLEKALELAVAHSRTYQNRKELVYLDALRLTLARHRFAPIFSAGEQGRYEGVVREVTSGVDAVTERDIQHSVNVTGTGRMDVLLRTGARLSTDLTTDFLRFLTVGPQSVSSSRLAATLTQPLLRGGGYRVTIENLTQAERDVLYSMRDFTRFRKEFSVQVASAYYRILLAREVARNNWLGLQNFKRNAERGRAFVDVDQMTLAGLGQLEQAELSSESQWINAARNYQQTLDDFKVEQLGLPADTRLVLDSSDLEKLEIMHPDIALDQAVRVAQVSRLDLQTVRDRVEDAARRVKVASNGLLPDLDLVLSGSLDGKPNRPLAFNFDRARWNAGLNLDLPLDRKAERNTYRAALIAYDRSLRERQLAEDEVRLGITQDLRNLDQAKRQFEIAEGTVDLGKRRVEEEQLRQEFGLNTARDVVEAQTDLVDALNQRTTTLVNHTVARLEFWRDMGILFIKDRGRWEEGRPEEIVPSDAGAPAASEAISLRARDATQPPGNSSTDS